MRNYLAAAIVLAAGIGAASCTGWQQRVYGAECSRAGLTTGTPEYQSCMELARRRDMGEAQGDLAVGGVVAGAAAVVSAATPPTSADRGYAPLGRQSLNGDRRTCGYLTPSGWVDVNVGISQSCPANYAY